MLSIRIAGLWALLCCLIPERADSVLSKERRPVPSYFPCILIIVAGAAQFANWTVRDFSFLLEWSYCEMLLALLEHHSRNECSDNRSSLTLLVISALRLKETNARQREDDLGAADSAALVRECTNRPCVLVLFSVRNDVAVCLGMHWTRVAMSLSDSSVCL